MINNKNTFILDRIMNKIQKDLNNNCWIFKGEHSQKYGRIRFNNQKILVHRYTYWYYKKKNIISWDDFTKSGISVLHNCPNGDNPQCCNPDHLWEGTLLDNNKDRNKKGRTAKLNGEQNPNHKLTNKQVLEIYKTTDTLKNIAKKYNVNYTNIWNIKTCKSWGWLTRP